MNFIFNELGDESACKLRIEADALCRCFILAKLQNICEFRESNFNSKSTLLQKNPQKDHLKMFPNSILHKL